jgi:hypothetical protein
MTTVLLLSALFATLPELESPAIAEKPGQPPSLEEVRAAYLEALQDSAKRIKPVYADVVPNLAEVYVQLKDVEGLSHAERSRMRGVAKSRLEELRDQLIRQVLRDRKLAERKNRSQKRGGVREPVDEKAALLAAGGASAQAVELIDLIQNTIEPESWQRAGGQGTISYFDLLKVLVVRQTGEVHHQLGGTLEQLRK